MFSKECTIIYSNSTILGPTAGSCMYLEVETIFSYIVLSDSKQKDNYKDQTLICYCNELFVKLCYIRLKENYPVNCALNWQAGCFLDKNFLRIPEF